MAALLLEIEVETFPIAGTFTSSRGSKTEARVVVATVTDRQHRGRGEGVPYGRYGETVESVVAQLRMATGVETRSVLAERLPAGAARNALDCALWDLEAKRTGQSAAMRAGVTLPPSALTCFTLSLADPSAMASKARDARDMPLLKLKLGGAGDAERMRAVRAARPDARLVADANEAWRSDQAEELLAVAAGCGVECIEQPFPVGADHVLSGRSRNVAICADESVHTRADLDRIGSLYDAVNVKLDKAGGLTEALALVAEARRRGLKVMVGCMLATSLAMAPASLLAGQADWLDLDGPLLLARDREPAIAYSAGRMHLPVPPALWG
jgi:L-alanine-DL-glutamate epimerase-like enolase superfamily enzyme